MIIYLTEDNFKVTHKYFHFNNLLRDDIKSSEKNSILNKGEGGGQNGLSHL